MLFPFLFLILANLIAFWPFTEIFSTPTQILGTSYVDELSFVWIFDRLSDNFFHLHSLFDGRILYPYTQSLLTSECVILLSFIYRFFYLFISNKILCFNLVVLSIFSLNFISSYWVLNRFFSKSISALSAFLFAFHFIRVTRLGHVHVICTFCFPLAFYFLYTKQLYRWALILALQFYFSLMSGLLLTIGCIPFFLMNPFYKKDYLKAYGLLALCLSPLIYSYVHMALTVWPNISPRNANPYGNTLSSFFNYKAWFIGFLPTALSLLGIVYLHKHASRKQKFLLYGTMLFAIVFSMGTHAKLYNLFYIIFPGVQFLRVPERVAFHYLLGVCLLSAFGLKFLLAHLKKDSHRYFILAVLTLIAFAENRRPLSLSGIPPYASDYVSDLKVSENLPLLFLPFDDIPLNSLRMYTSLIYDQPMANGYTRFFPKSYFEIEKLSQDLSENRETEVAIKRLKELGLKRIVFDQKINLPTWAKKLPTKTFADNSVVIRLD